VYKSNERVYKHTALSGEDIAQAESSINRNNCPVWQVSARGVVFRSTGSAAPSVVYFVLPAQAGKVLRHLTVTKVPGHYVRLVSNQSEILVGFGANLLGVKNSVERNV